jgi:hypothetical protein
VLHTAATAAAVAVIQHMIVLYLFLCSLSSSGMTNASVLPEPVLAAPSTSLAASACGIAATCKTRNTRDDYVEHCYSTD